MSSSLSSSAPVSTILDALSSLIRAAVESSSTRSLLTTLLARIEREPDLAPHVATALVPFLALHPSTEPAPSSTSLPPIGAPVPAVGAPETKRRDDDATARFCALFCSSAYLLTPRTVHSVPPHRHVTRPSHRLAGSYEKKREQSRM